MYVPLMLGGASSVPASPDKLVKHRGTVGALSQDQHAAVAAQQDLLKYRTLQGEHQGVGLDHLHLVRIGCLHPQRHVASIALNQKGLQTLHQDQGMADGVPVAATILGSFSFHRTWVFLRKQKELVDLKDWMHFINKTKLRVSYLLGQIVG